MPEELDFHGELERIADADPFVPFTVVTVSGDRYIVPVADWVMYKGDVVYIQRPKIGSVMIRVYNVVAIEFHETAQK
jgi:hypothetical protein